MRKRAKDMTPDELQSALRTIRARCGALKWHDDWSPQKIRRKDRPRCGAMTRAGAPCQAPAVWDRERDEALNGRCRRHGGLSTGPKSQEGRQRAIEAMKEGHRRWRDRRKATLQNVT